MLARLRDRTVPRCGVALPGSATDLILMSPVMRRLRGSLLRLVRRRILSMAVGLLLVALATWLRYCAVSDQWWVEGVALVVIASGVALFWTGLTGTAPDWVE